MGRINLRKKKKKRKFKYIFIVSIIYISFSYSFYYMIKGSRSLSNEKFINMLVTSGNANMLNKYRGVSIINGTMKFFLNIDFTNPVSIFNDSILGYGYNDKKKEIEKTIAINYNDDYSDMEDLKKVSDFINDPNPKVVNNPIVYLYNSHQLENYNNDKLEIYGITPNVQMLSYILREKLDEKGIETIVEDANMSDILEANGWDYSYSYSASRSKLIAKMKKYPGLKYFIDLHRDSIPRSMSTVSINNRNYARVLFVIGQDYNNWEANYKLASDLNTFITSSYSNLSRGIIKKTGKYVNGVYNQDLNSNVILIEVGGNENTVEEVYNTSVALAEVLEKYIKGA
ncbi:MAG: stage II sporulation protein P [Bacilli bacterium]|nr:stage II sporulation protein P [Bacilli bacterium]